MAAYILGVLGPLVAAIGAAFLVIDAVRGPVLWYEEVYFPRGALKLLREGHEINMRLLRSLPRPPYTEDHIKGLINDEIARYNVEVADQEKRAGEKTVGERFRSRTRAEWGFGLIAIGSLMQALSVMIK